jgi:hypothetical protein
LPYDVVEPANETGFRSFIVNSRLLGSRLDLIYYYDEQHDETDTEIESTESEYEHGERWIGPLLRW